FVDVFDTHPRQQSHQLRTGLSRIDRPHMAWLVVGDLRRYRIEIERQRVAAVQIPQIPAGFIGVFGNQSRILVIDQVQVLVAQTESGGRLGGYDRVTGSDRFGQQTYVVPSSTAGATQVPGGDPRHPRGCLPRRDVDVD